MINSKVEILDSLRAFAAISVCLFHFVCTTTGYINNESVLGVFEVGQYGVQLFFVISGFVIPWAMHHAGYKLKNFFTFFLKRLARLEPPYLFSILLVLAVFYLRKELFGRSNDHMEISWKQVVLHLGYMIPFFEGYKWLNNVYWTLAIEFQYYLFIALMFAPLVSYGRLFRIVFYSLIIGLTFLVPDGFLFYWLPIFLIGILLFLYKAKYILKEEYYCVTGLLFCFCFYKYPVAAVIYSAIPVASVLLCQDIKIFALHSFGKFSYSIYLIHPILGASLINILSYKYNSTVEKPFVILAGLAVTIFCSWVTYLLIERPSKNLSSSIKYKSD